MKVIENTTAYKCEFCGRTSLNRGNMVSHEMAEWMERFCSLARRGKRRKTTYKTIRRDCAKRNRHK